MCISICMEWKARIAAEPWHPKHNHYSRWNVDPLFRSTNNARTLHIEVVKITSQEESAPTKFWSQRYDAPEHCATQPYNNHHLVRITHIKMSHKKTIGEEQVFSASRQRASHTAASFREFVGKKHIEIFPHPPYSPDLVGCDFWIFSRL